MTIGSESNHAGAVARQVGQRRPDDPCRIRWCRRILRQPLDFTPTVPAFVVHDPRPFPAFPLPYRVSQRAAARSGLQFLSLRRRFSRRETRPVVFAARSEITWKNSRWPRVRTAVPGKSWIFLLYLRPRYGRLHGTGCQRPSGRCIWALSAVATPPRTARGWPGDQGSARAPSTC